MKGVCDRVWSLPELSVTAALLLSGAPAQAVHAQPVLADPPTAAAPTPQQPVTARSESDPSEPAPGDIVVTAQRRSQSIQNVGIAMTALNSTALSRLAVSNATGITTVVPNLRFIMLGGAVVNFNIRGISQNDYADHLEPPAAIYVDDSYLSTTSPSLRRRTSARRPMLSAACASVWPKSAVGKLRCLPRTSGMRNIAILLST